MVSGVQIPEPCRLKGNLYFMCQMTLRCKLEMETTRLADKLAWGRTGDYRKGRKQG